MERPALKEDVKYMEEQTGVHLLMVSIASVFSMLLALITYAMEWELWTIPMIVVSIAAMWVIHIGRIGTGALFEYLCIGIMIVEVFYYGVHSGSLYNVPVVVCVLLFMLSLLNKKALLYVVGGVYTLVLLYHLFFIGDINFNMERQDFIQLVIGLAAAVSALILSGSMIDRRRAEKRGFFEMAEQMEETKRKNAEFLSNVSHELRTPINMVTGISEIALEKELPLALREDMQSIQMAGKRLAGQVSNILDYTEIFGETLVVINENYMISSVINDVVARAAMQNAGSDVEIVFDFDTTIPSVLVGDAEKISRIIRLILKNAMKFTETGAIYVRVGYRRESYGLNLDIDICDTGIGMSPEQVAKVYDDFYQADAGYSRYAGGLGLGISIAQGLLHVMEGCMYFESREGEGTKVHISIPQGIADSTPSMVVQNPKQFCIGCYFKQERYSRNEVRQFYDDMVRHMAEELGLEAYRAYHLETLKRMLQNQSLTHLFIALPEYEEDASYFEELGKSICVVLVAQNDFALPEESNLIFLPKPFFALPIVNLLNGVTHGNDLRESLCEDRVFYCRDVRALVVDDEEMNLMVARGILNSYRIEIDICLSGAQAVEQCADTDYDLIFLDHMMPGMDGVETLKQIRLIRDGFYENVPIIALTANAISGAREMFKNEGFTEFIPKPIERPVLERVLRKILPEGNIQYDSEEDNANTAAPAAEEVQAADTMRVAEPVPEPEIKGAMFAELGRFGIDTEMGLNYCYGAEDFYLEMLQMYCSQSTERRAEIVGMYENEDWEGYVVKVHALKSTSLTIGAQKVSEQAKALELAGKKDDIAYIRENHALFIQAYDALCRGIADSVPPAGSGEGDTL